LSEDIRQHNAVNTERRHGEKEQQANIQVLTMIPGATGTTAKDMSTVTKITAGGHDEDRLIANGGIQSSFMKI